MQTVDKNRASRPFVKRKRAPIEFSLRVKNIGTGVRVRDLKTALNERGIKPRYTQTLFLVNQSNGKKLDQEMREKNQHRRNNDGY